MLKLEKALRLMTVSSAQLQRRYQTLLNKTQKNRKRVNQAYDFVFINNMLLAHSYVHSFACPPSHAWQGWQLGQREYELHSPLYLLLGLCQKI